MIVILIMVQVISTESVPPTCVQIIVKMVTMATVFLTKVRVNVLRVIMDII